MVDIQDMEDGFYPLVCFYINDKDELKSRHDKRISSKDVANIIKQWVDLHSDNKD